MLNTTDPNATLVKLSGMLRIRTTFDRIRLRILNKKMNNFKYLSKFFLSNFLFRIYFVKFRI